MKKIKMLRDEKGSPNGFTVEKYKANEEYNVPDSLYQSFVCVMKCAIPVNDVIEDIEIVNKQIKETPQNKMIEVPNNKEAIIKTEEVIEIEQKIEEEKKETLKNIKKKKK